MQIVFFVKFTESFASFLLENDVKYELKEFLILTYILVLASIDFLLLSNKVCSNYFSLGLFMPFFVRPLFK